MIWSQLLETALRWQLLNSHVLKSASGGKSSSTRCCTRGITCDRGVKTNGKQLVWSTCDTGNAFRDLVSISNDRPARAVARQPPHSSSLDQNGDPCFMPVAALLANELLKLMAAGLLQSSCSEEGAFRDLVSSLGNGPAPATSEQPRSQVRVWWKKFIHQMLHTWHHL